MAPGERGTKSTTRGNAGDISGAYKTYSIQGEGKMEPPRVWGSEQGCQGGSCKKWSRGHRSACGGETHGGG